MEHRWGVRVLVDIPVRLRCRGSNCVGAIINISLSGAFIRMEKALNRFAPLEIELEGLEGCTVPSFVVRVQSDGVGVEWAGRLPRMLMTALLERSLSSNAAPAPFIIYDAVA